MPKKKSDKKIECFSASFSDILVCQKPSDKPYLEVFVEKPENVTQQGLGVLAGILEITDESEDSSYVVNYLVSVIKKEYYSKAKRGTIESFEAALRKANLALAKLAEHESISWIGKTNAILLAIDKNNLHLSQSGNARALLLRGKTLTDISDDASQIEAPNPMKTFTDIVSGRLEENDKLIVTTEEMFDIFSLEEIKKSALKFSSPEFVQFLKTALVNELDRSASLVVEIKKEEKIQNISSDEDETERNNFNAFSQAAFSKKTPAKKKPSPIPTSPAVQNDANENFADDENKRQKMANEIKEEIAKSNGEFVDKKTGHIYIKENYPAPLEEESSMLETLDAWQEKLSGAWSATGNSFKTLAQRTRDFKRPDTRRTAPQENPLEAMREEKNTRMSRRERFDKKPAVIGEKIKGIAKVIAIFWQENYPSVKRGLIIFYTKTSDFLVHTFQAVMLFILQKSRQGWLAVEKYRKEKREKKEQLEVAPEKNPVVSIPETISLPGEKKDWMEKYSEKLSASSQAALASPVPIISSGENFEKKIRPRVFQKVLPHFSNLKNLLAKMDYTQKVYTALAIVLLFIVPYFLAKIGSKPTPKVVPIETPFIQALPLEQDQKVTRVENISSLYSDENIASIINLNDALFAMDAKNIIDVKNNALYPLPDNFTPKEIIGMDDLDLLFILGQDNRIVSWSPTSKKFLDNTFALPANASVTSIGTYLTYLYVLDGKNGQIYRYPRAEGGFGEKTDWLKSGETAVGATTMGLSDNLYLVQNNKLTQFFQGKKQDFTLEESATPFSFDAIFTKRDDQFVYALDKNNARIVKFDLTGKIVAQYYNAEIKNATGFTVGETENAIYFSTSTNVETFKMN